MKQKFYSILHRLLIRKSSYRFRNKFLRKIWQTIWDFSINSYKGEITFKLHGESVKMKNGYPYPLFINTYYCYNFPLIEIVYHLFKIFNRPINYVDIGAAIGDTMLLLFQKCPNMIGYYYCIDGDDEFFELLQYNLRSHSNGVLIKVLLSDYNHRNENSLLRTHMGTASSQGKEIINAITLDELLLDKQKVTNIDLIKIDVDGLDGKVISGAKRIIENFRPVIIFEWHPILYKKTGNSSIRPFEELSEQGYNKFVFYDKLGKFSHFQSDFNKDGIEFLTNLCLRDIYASDWHYDVIALSDNKSLSVYELAEMSFTKTISL